MMLFNSQNTTKQYDVARKSKHHQNYDVQQKLKHHQTV